ncbi:hypothetical protein PP175_04130 [Aneurinibacillus sp. Ricciae_BoGa-3]|uniref:hypothetical protein n=1 Tax=Aneurinibacillus sp. Ricciae_BoGa-3 TaxID=3022697 RepID=UPI0023412604|nr:hypothetical protein [Aneurinibacillus sp. Ricciae_BoGa-3]WCK55183.1 hypothetical protein PP175_04130 [Aneurinibacillus sp. Ricciae_BoGa-3]
MSPVLTRIAAMAACLILSGCSLFPSPETLVTAPQANVQASGNRDRQQIAQPFIPPGYRLIAGQHQDNLPAVSQFDVDGDGVPELLCTIASKTNGYNGGFFALKKIGAQWKKMFELTGEAASVYSFTQADLIGDGKKELLVSYFVGGSAGESVVAYSWQNPTLRPLASVMANRLELEDMPDKVGKRDGKSELGIWIKDTGTFYIVDVLRYENGRFVPAEDVYPYYFKKVASYYESLSSGNGQESKSVKSPLLYYYLADAYVKADEYQKALAVCDRARREFPAKEVSPAQQSYIENLTIVRGIALIGTGSFKEAEKILQPLADKRTTPGAGQPAAFPTILEAAYYMGKAAQGQHEDAKARACYNQVLLMAKKTIDPYDKAQQERWVEKSRQALQKLSPLK